MESYASTCRIELVCALRAARWCLACGRRAGKTPAAPRSPRTLSVARWLAQASLTRIQI